MKFRLISRARVNYTFLELLNALFVSDKKIQKRLDCERLLSNYYSEECACLVPSSRDAIYELLFRLPQKKVVVPSYTCMVVNEAVLLAGKEIVYAKSDLDTFNSTYLEYIDKDCVVIATHQYGLPCNIKEVAERCREVGAVLIEDCATSMGTTVDGQMTGTFGDYAVVSFNQSKTLNVPPFGGVLIGKNAEMLKNIRETAGWLDGGVGFKIKGIAKGLAFVLAKNTFVYRLMHWATIDRKGKLQRTEHEKPSETKTDFYKVRFTEWQASILLSQLKKLDGILKKRKEVYSYYDKHINNPLLTKPVHYENAVCTRYAVLCEDRNTFYKKCVEQGVDMDFSHCSIGCPESFEFEHGLASKILNVPFYCGLTQKEMAKVVSVINSVKA